MTKMYKTLVLGN